MTSATPVTDRDMTRAASIFAVLVLTSAASGTAGTVMAGPAICPEDIIAKMNQADEGRDRRLKEYTALRHYTLRGEKGRQSEMTVRLVYNSTTGKTFSVLAQNGSEGLFRRVFEKVMQAEVETSRNNGRNDNSISPKNYNFRLLGQETHDGRNCYVLQLLPRRKSKYLIDGKAWVDAEDYALIRLEGRTAGSVSFWVGRPYIVQSFQKVGNFWLASTNNSVANAKLIGRTELTINSSDYSVAGMEHMQVAEKVHASGVD